MEILQNYPYLIELLISLSYIAIGISLIVLGKIVYNTVYRNIDVNRQLVIHDNLAFSFSYVGYFIGMLIVIGASIIGESFGWLQDIKSILYYSTIGIFLLHVSIWIANKAILTRFKIKEEIISDQNEGTGVIEAAIYISTGLVLYGAISGESGGLIMGTITSLIYWGIGLLILIITSKLYSLLIKYDVHAEIEKDNVAAGVAYAGVLISISIITMNALMGDFVDWQTTALDVFVQSLLGLVLLPLMRLIADKILLPGQNLTDEIVNQEKPNIGAAVVVAFAYIGSAVLVAWSL